MGNKSMYEKRVIPVWSIRLPISYRLLLNKIGKRLEMSDVETIKHLIELEAISKLGDVATRYVLEAFDEQGFCKHDKLGICSKSLAQVRLDKNRRYCIRKCENPF